MSNWQDPEYRKRVRKGVHSVTAPGIGEFFQRLGKAAGDTPGVIWDFITSGGGEASDSGSQEQGPGLGEEIGEFREDWIEANPGEGGGDRMDQGRGGRGASVANEGTPRVSPRARQEPSPEMESEGPGMAADIDFILGSDNPNDRFARMKQALAGGGTISNRDAAEVASEAYATVTGSNPMWSEDDVYEVFTDPAMIEVILAGL